MRKALPIMIGVGSAFGGKLTPEMIQAFCDNETQARKLTQEVQARELAKLPVKLPKELQNMIDRGYVRKEDLKTV